MVRVVVLCMFMCVLSGTPSLEKGKGDLGFQNIRAISNYFVLEMHDVHHETS